MIDPPFYTVRFFKVVCETQCMDSNQIIAVLGKPDEGYEIISKSSKLYMQCGQDNVSYSVTLIGTWFLSNNCSLLRKYCIGAIFYEGLFHILKEYGFWDNINWCSSSPYFRSIFMLM